MPHPGAPVVPTAAYARSAASGAPDQLAGAHFYRLGARLGEGGGGTVFQATRIDNGQTVAVKLMCEESSRTPAERNRARARFAREQRLCERLHHPNVVALLDHGETLDGQLFAVFEFVPGRTLRDVLAAEGALSAVTTGLLMTQVLEGLAAAHRQGVVHRDLKPQNVMVTMIDGAPQAKILDFGIGALLADAGRTDGCTLTQTTEVLGSPQYCAPEQLRNEKPTIRTDLYAWGLLVIECLTGQAVIQGASVADILYQQLDPVDVALPPAIAAHPLGTVLRRALNKDPRRRVRSASELAADFGALHFPALVGQFTYRRAVRKDAATGSPGATSVDQAGSYRQVTMLCCSVSLAGDDSPVAAAGVEDLDAYAQQWLTRCADIAVGYGGEACGRLGDTLLFHFGSQDGIDRPARRAARAALEMMRHANRTRHAATAQRQDAASSIGWNVEIAAALHAGPVPGQGPLAGYGATAAAAAKLLRLATPGDILFSDEARQLLERHADYTRTALRLTHAGHAPQAVYALVGERHEHAPFDLLDRGTMAPMVGRARERDALLRAWRHMAAPATYGADAELQEPRLARLVVGDPGIGKSRLVYELCEAVRKAGHGFAYCACLPERINDALFPLLRFVATHWQIDLDGEPAAALAALERTIAPLACDQAAARATLAAWLGLEREPGGLRWSSARQQQALFEVLRELVASLGDGGPALLVMEDVQWIDRASLDFLESLWRSPQGHAVCVVMTSRPEALDRWRDCSERLSLRRLSRADTRELVVALLDRPDLDGALLDALTRRTAGIPLFVEELVRELVISGASTDADVLPQALAEPGPYPLPGSLRDMLELAVDRIDGARDTVQLASAIGLEIDGQLLADASPHPPSVLDDHVRRLLEARVIYAQHRLGGVSYAFRHALFRDAAYESMPVAVRRRNHARLARALGTRPERGHGMHAINIAHHFVRAQAFRQAVPYGIRAAQRALERALHDDAIRYAQHVHEWLAQCRYPGRARDAASADLTLVHAMMARFGWAAPQVQDRTARLLREVGNLDDTQLAASVLWTLATCHHVASDRPAVQRIAMQLIALAGTSGDPGIRVAADAMHGMSLWIDGHYPAARAALEAALSRYEVARDVDHRRVFGLDTRAWSMSALASVIWSMEDDPGAALAMARQAVHLATCADHLPTLGVTLMYFARMQQCDGDRDGARATAGIILRLSRVYGLSAVERYAAVIHAWSDGDRAAIVEHVEALRRSGCLLGLTYYASLSAELDAARGDYASALTGIEDCLTLCETSGERYYQPELLLRKSDYLLNADPDGARDAAIDACRQSLERAGAAGMARTVSKAREALARIRQPETSTQMY
jgi:TOMM system kinase/cyclase fusion protein